jgi:hypothetical protein
VTKLLLSIHVLAAILAVGPVAVAASMFPATLRRATAAAHPAAAPASSARDATGHAGAAHAATTPASATSAATEAGTGAVPAIAAGDAAAGGDHLATLRVLHRICRVYAVLGVVVLVFGLATASSLGVLTDPWLLVSIALTIAAAAVLGLLVLPGQRDALADRSAPARRLAMYTGLFNLLWAVVTVLMITRPGSTTGA